MPNRREFLRTTGLGGMAVAAGDLEDLVKPIENPLKKYPHRQWEDQYRQEFQGTRGDAVGYAFHCSNCQGNCAFQVFAANGKITREEQLARYPQIRRNIPDANPRGCNKGTLHSESLHDPDRILTPMKRTGKRGEGKWEPVSWDRAVSDISRKVVDTISKHGLSSLMVYTGTGLMSQAGRGGPERLGALLGATQLNIASSVGDMFTGATLAYGIPFVGYSTDAWFECDLVLLWGINPNQTRIPDAHYLWEAKYNGATVVTISPDFNSTASQSSLWVPVKPGTDSFLSMSMVHVILTEKLYNESFIREQTDLPFLIRTDTGKYLRMVDGVSLPGPAEGADPAKGAPPLFFVWDRKTGKAVPVPGAGGHPGKTLALGELDPALEGTFEVSVDGKPVAVTTVFERIREEAGKFAPEATAPLTGVHPSTVRLLATRLASSKKAIVNLGFSLNKYMWGILTSWNAALLCALTGHTGKTGGLDCENFWNFLSVIPLYNPKPPRYQSGFLTEWKTGRLWETMETHYSDEELGPAVGMTKKEIRSLSESVAKNKTLPVYGTPKAALLFADNAFRRNKSLNHYRDAALKNLDLLVTVNHRMDTTSEYADYVLPAASHYEKWDVRFELGFHRFANLMMPPEGVSPQGESKTEWEICRLLSEGIEKAAGQKGMKSVNDPDFGVTRDFHTLAKDFTLEGKLLTDKDVVQHVMATSPAMEHATFESMEKNGYVTMTEKAGLLSPLHPTEPYQPFEAQVGQKMPYMTMTGRQQFYMDHDLFLKLGAPCPTAKPPVRPKKFPYTFYSPHTRYGIHSQWRSNKHMMRLQRGTPHVYLGTGLAEGKGIQDGDRVRVFNDVGAFVAMAKVTPVMPPDTVMIDHAWEPPTSSRGGAD